MTVNWDFLKEYGTKYPHEVAAQFESTDLKTLREFLEDAPEAIVSKIFPYLKSAYIVKWIGFLGLESARPFLWALSHEKLVSILSLMERSQQKQLLDCLDPKTRLKILDLIQFGTGFIGSIVEPCFSVVSIDATIHTVLNQFDALESLSENIYILNDQQELMGRVDIYKLLRDRNKTDNAVTQVMTDIKYRISANTPIHVVYQHRAWRELSTLPVINHKNHLIGIISYEKLKEKVYPKYRTPHRGGITNDYTSISELIWQTVFDMVDSK